MAVTLLASQCPTLPTPAALLSIADAGSLSGGNAPVSESIIGGQTAPWTPIQRRNATRQDLIGRHGGGGYAVATGLTLTAPGSGLLLGVSAGLAMIDGPVEVESATTLAIPNNATRAWVWLLQNGTLTTTLQVGGSIPEPAGACCVLGSCVSDATDITSVDTSGVLSVRGGMLWRATADNGEPGDTPPASLAFFARTQGGLYFWDGTGYTDLSQPTQIPASVQTGSAYTFVPADAGTVVEGNSASAQTFTLDTHANQALPVGSVIQICQYGAGQITLVGAGGVTLHADGGKLKSAGQYAVMSARQRAADEWILSGDLTA